MFKNLIIFVLFVIITSNISAQTTKIDSLKLAYENCSSDSCKAKTTKKIFWYWADTNLDSAKKYMNEYLEYFIEKKFDYGIIMATTALTYIEESNQNYVECIRIMSYSLTKLTGKENKAVLLINLGETNRAIEKFDASIDVLLEAISISKEIENNNLLSRSYNRIAATYYEIGELEKSLTYTDSSIFIAKQENNIRLLANNYEIAGSIYRSQEKYYRAIDLYLNALEINESIPDTEAMTNNYTNIGISYYMLDESQKAIFYLEKSTEMNVKLNQKYNLLNSMNFLSRAYAAVGEFQKAYYISDSAMSLRVRLFDDQENERINDLNKKYEVDKKELLIKQKEESLKNKEQIIKQKNIQNIIIVGILFLVLIFLFIGFKFQKKLKEKNRLLNLQKEEIDAQKNELLEKNSSLLKMGEFKQSMTQMIVHDLKNPLNRIITLTKHSDDLNDRKLRESSMSMLNLVENILSYAKYQHSEMILEMQPINLNSVVKMAHEQTMFLFEQKGITFVYEPETNFYVEAEEQTLIRVLVNFITNSIKFTPSGGEIKITARKSENRVLIKFSDTGIGISPKKTENIFNIYEQTNVKNINNISSTGIGLFFCKNAVKAFGSDIRVASEKNKGSIFYFYLKLLNEKNQSKINIDSETFIIKLEKDEKDFLLPYIQEISKFEIFEITSLKRILARIKYFSNNTQNIVNELTNAVANMNTSKYNRILDIFKEL